MSNVSVVRIARICHEANRLYCESLGDNTQDEWNYSPDWQQESAINGVIAIRDGKVKTPRDSHSNWLDEKVAKGWVYGAEKDVDKREHPCILPFEQLPVEQQLKDKLFFAIVKALT